MFQVQEAVHGVTLEECQAALQNHSWNIQKAVNYLKVRPPPSQQDLTATTQRRRVSLLFQRLVSHDSSGSVGKTGPALLLLPPVGCK